MARHYKEIAHAIDRDGDTTSIRRLNEEVHDLRDAERKLDMADINSTDAVDALRSMSDRIAQLEESNTRIEQQLKAMVVETKNTLEHAQQAALSGVDEAQKKASEITIKNINEVTKRSEDYINTMTQESKRRIERLALVTLPDKLFNFIRLVVLIFMLFILAHVVWQMAA